jgi:hypothetical protein
MSRRIVFAGGAQTRALARIYRGEIAATNGDDVVFIGTGAVGTDQARSTLLLADVLAMEVDEDGDAIAAADLPGQAELVRIPNLYCDFLWPFAGRAHPRNRGAFALPGGPYPAEHGDRFLDQMVAENVDEDVAIARYLAMDIAREGELDSRLTDRLAIQRQLDAAAGYDLAGFVADRFRHEPLFRTRQRMTMPLLARLTAQFLAKLGVADWKPESLKRVPFPAGAQPIHPGVIAHFGLTWVAADQEYPVNDEGFFSFDAFCRRYMRFAWNEALHRGIQTAKTNPQAALPDLEQGLAESPESRLGLLARTAARRAAGLEDAGPAILIDEDSYDPIDEAAPLDDAPEAAAPAEPHSTDPAPVAVEAAHEAEPEADLLAAAAPIQADGQADTTPHESSSEPGLYDSVAEDDLIGLAAPAPEPASATDITEAALDTDTAPAEPAASAKLPGAQEPPASPAETPAPSVQITRTPAPGKPAGLAPAPQAAGLRRPPSPGSTDDGFTDFRPAIADQPTQAAAVNELIDVLPSMLPAFADMAHAPDRPFDTMPELMPPPPLRPILPPELQDDAPKPGLLARMLGRK